MTPCFCRVKHNPPETYGDCFRACIASLLDVSRPEDVPHFFETGEMNYSLLSGWLAERKLAPVIIVYDGDTPLADMLEGFTNQNHGHFLLFAKNKSGHDHVWIMQGTEIKHDPGWVRSDIGGTNDQDVWIIMVLAVK